MLTDEQIENAKKTTVYSGKEPHSHEHNDCIRMAYEWLDAQVKTKTIVRNARGFKHLIEKWCGRYVSQSDVEVAATIHKEIKGKYPYFNISERLTDPKVERLKGISEAFTQGQNSSHDPKVYKIKE